MNDLFVFRLLLVVVAIVIIFALVSQYTRNNQKQQQEQQASPSKQERPHRGSGSGFPQDESWERFDTSRTYQDQELQQAPEQEQYSSIVASSDKVAASSDKRQRSTEVVPPAPPSFSQKGRSKDPVPFENVDTEMYRAVDYKPDANKYHTDNYFPQDRTTTQDLLPGKDAANSKWAQVNPAGQGDLQNVMLLNAGHHMGTSTQSQTMRNPNLQLRSEYPNPKADVGPWNYSTIDNDHDRRYFELGEP